MEGVRRVKTSATLWPQKPSDFSWQQAHQVDVPTVSSPVGDSAVSSFYCSPSADGHGQSRGLPALAGQRSGSRSGSSANSPDKSARKAVTSTSYVAGSSSGMAV
jgi:hypothetical protein